MKKINNFVQVGEALHRTPSQDKENFRKVYNAKHCECQAYEAEKQRKNQDLVEALRKIFNSQLKTKG